MSRSRPATNPISYHKHTGQYYVTRAGKRIYLGADQEVALAKYHRLNLEMTEPVAPVVQIPISLKELANRFLSAQRANWRNATTTLKSYHNWLGRFLKDHPRLKVCDFSVEMFAAWKLSLRERKYSPKSINHYLAAVRSMFAFAEDTGLLTKAPPLKRVKNESLRNNSGGEKVLYSAEQISKLVKLADTQLKAMILLGLNCGFGPKDIHDLLWEDIKEERVTLPRSKTGVCQTFLLWPETQNALKSLLEERKIRIERLEKRHRFRTDNGRVFVTRFWKPWAKDSVAEQFRKLCQKAEVPCYGFYRLRHCASTAMSLVTNPHVHRKFMRHAQLQQQVTYTHTPDNEVDAAILKAKEKILDVGDTISGPGRSPEQEEVA